MDEPSDAAAIAQFPEPGEFTFDPDRYLEHVRRVKVEEAGADAIELSIYHVPTDARETGAEVERRLLDAVRQVKWSCRTLMSCCCG